MRKVPLLDLGNVVVRVDFSPFLGWLGDKAGRDPSAIAPLLHSSLFYELEFGDLRPDAFVRRVSRLYGVDLDAAEFEERFCGIFPGLVDGIEPVLAELTARGPVYCLSNTNEMHLRYLRAHFPELAAFTRIFASHELRKRKPYPAIYQDIAIELGLPAEELVFFDDVAANVEGALRAGLEAHVFRDPAGIAAVMKEAENEI